MDQTASQALRNLLIVPDNRLDDPWGTGTAATVTGGAWLGARPLTHILDPRLLLAAQSDGLDPEATRWTIDYGGLTDLRVCVVWGIMSRLARIRHVISLDPAATEIVYDSGWQDWDPVIGPAWTLPRSHPSYGHGRLPERIRRLYPQRFWHSVAPEAVLGRYEHIMIDDQSSAAGSVSIQRCWTGAGWQTSVPVEYGCEWGWEDTSEVRRLLSGRADIYRGARLRTMDVRIEGLPVDEAMLQVYDMQGRVGISEQLYVSWDPTDTRHLHRHSGLARMAALSPAGLARHDWIDAGFKFIEEVA